MITLTEKAAQKIQELVEKEKDKEEKGLRVKVVGGGCSGLSYQLDLDTPKRNEWSMHCESCNSHNIVLFDPNNIDFNKLVSGQNISEEDKQQEIEHLRNGQWACCRGECRGKITIKRENEADKVFEEHGAKVIVDPKSHLYLTGMRVDYHDNKLQGAGFVIENPNAKGSCGCGSSFTA